MTLVSQIGQRSELLAQLFLQDLKPEILSRPSEDVGFDFLVGFRNSAGGLNMFGIEVKGTERPPAGSFPLDKRTFLRLAESNLPACLLVDRGAPPINRMATQVSVPVTEINDKTKVELRRQMLKEAA